MASFLPISESVDFTCFLASPERNLSTASVIRYNMCGDTFMTTGYIYMDVVISLEAFDLSLSSLWLLLIYLL